jgi:glycerate 2-kinase
LAFLAGLAEADPVIADRVCFLSAGTDGGDGPTDAAGAFADIGILSNARELGLDPRAYLAANDSYRFFDRTGGLLRTGPTNTNVCDIQIVLIR